MKENALIICIWLLVVGKAQAQVAFVNSYNHRGYAPNATSQLDFNNDLGTAFHIEPYLGASASLAYGDFIQRQKSFHDVAEEGTDFRGAIQPVVMGTGGVQLRYMPFSDGVLSNIGLSVGIQYFQKGFVNKFKSTHNAPLGYTDVTDYKEIYRFNYWSIPIQVRWGKKWFATLGLSLSKHLAGNKIQKLKREQSGAGSLNGGFENDIKERKTVEKSAVKKSQKDFLIGGGIHLNERNAIAARVNIGGKILAQPSENFGTVLFEFSFYKSFKLLKQ